MSLYICVCGILILIYVCQGGRCLKGNGVFGSISDTEFVYGTSDDMHVHIIFSVSSISSHVDCSGLRCIFTSRQIK